MNCRINKCKNRDIAKGLCSKHYMAERRSNKKVTICKIENCEQESYISGLCKAHHVKQKKYGDPFYKKQLGNTYNGALYMKNRKEKISIYGASCEICGKPGKHIHHKDFGRSNHNIDNLQMLCNQCHRDKHYENERGSTYTSIYGKNQEKIAKELKLSIGRVSQLRKDGRLEQYLNNKEKKNTKFIRLYGSTIQELSDKLKVSKGKIFNMHKEGSLKTQRR